MIEVVVLYIFGVVLGIFIGIQITRWLKPKQASTKLKTIGNLRLDHSDPDSPYLFLELTDGLEAIYEENEVIVKVKIEDFIPRK